MTTRTRIVATSLLVLLPLLSVPARAAAPEPSGGTGLSAAEALVIATTDRGVSLDPATSYDAHSWEVLNAVAGGLLMLDASGEPYPALAAAMPTVSADGIRWTVKLRDGLRFPSGRPLTAEDVVRTLDRARSLGGEPAWLVSAFLAEVEAPDPGTVVFTLQQPTVFFPHLLTVPIYFPLDPSCAPADAAIDGTCNGLGRYVITRLDDGASLDLAANPGWPGEPPGVDRISIRYLGSPEAVAEAATGGRADVAWGSLPRDTVHALDGLSGARQWSGPSQFKRSLILVSTAEPLGDRRIRRALALMVDRDELASSVFDGAFEPLLSPIPSGVDGHRPTMPAPDLEAAVRLLREAGITEEKPLRLDLWWPSDHYGSQEPELAATLERQLEAGGLVEVALHDAPWQRYTTESGRCSYPAYLLGWQPDYLDVSTSVDFFALSTATKDLCSNFASADMDRLVLAAQTERDPARRLELYGRIQDLWAVEVPTIPLLQGTVSAVTFGDVSGVAIDPSGMLHYGELRKGNGASP